MPEKDGSDDKKSTKSVVNKKQKQLMNKEQLDLSNVAESFGGKIVGEPVELDEFKTTSPVTATVSKVKLNKVNNKFKLEVESYASPASLLLGEIYRAVGSTAGRAGLRFGVQARKVQTSRIHFVPAYRSPFAPRRRAGR